MTRALTAVACLLCVTAAAETVFEADFNDGAPEQWRFLNQRGECSGEWDPNEPPGPEAGSLRCDIPEDDSARPTWAAPRIDLKPATSYRLSYQVMLGDISDGAKGAYAILYENGEPSPDFWHMKSFMKGSRDWHEREMIFTTRDDCTWGELQLKLWECTGHAWFDDVTIEELGPGEVQTARRQEGRLVLPEDDGFALQTIWYPAHRRMAPTLHLLAGRTNPVAFFAWGDAEKVEDPHLVIEAPAEITIRGPVVCGRALPPDPVELTPEDTERDGAQYRRWRIPIREETLTHGLKPDEPNWTRYHFIYAEPGQGCPEQFAWYWRFENAGEQGPLHTIDARLQPNLGPNIEPVDGFDLYAQHSDAMRLPTEEGRDRVLDWAHYAGIRGGLALSYYQEELLPIDDAMAQKGWFTWTWRWYGYGGPAEDGQELVFDSADNRRRGTTCPQVQVEMLEPHATWLREFYADALKLDRDWLIMNYEPPSYHVCFCERCRRAFAERTGRDVDEVLAMTPQQIQALPAHAWGKFRCWQNEQIIANHAAVIEEIDSECVFGVCGPPFSEWTANHGKDIRLFDPYIGLHAPMIYRSPEQFEPAIRATCETTSSAVMPFTLGSDIMVRGVHPTAWDQWANMLATALSGGDGVILWVGLESLDGEMMNVLRRSMEQIRTIRPYIDGAERGAGVTVDARVRDVRTVTVNGEEIEVGSENSRIPVRNWQWSGQKGKMAALINYDRELSHTVRLTGEGIARAETLIGPDPSIEDNALVLNLAPGQLSVVTWQ